MSTFRSKPEVVEAHRWWTGKNVAGVYPDPENEGFYLVDESWGARVIDDGDWVVTRGTGERFVCKPDVFEATYTDR